MVPAERRANRDEDYSMERALGELQGQMSGIQRSLERIESRLDAGNLQMQELATSLKLGFLDEGMPQY